MSHGFHKFSRIMTNGQKAYGYSIELGEQPAQRCPVCVDKRGGHRLHWVEGRPLETCPKCAGELEDVMERRQRTKSGFALAKDRDAALVAEVDSRNKGTYAEPVKVTVREFLVDQWLPAIEGSIRPSTFTSYEGHVFKYIVPALGTLLLRQLTTADVDTFYSQLAKTKGGRGGQCLSPKTRRLVHITLRCALAYAVAQHPPLVPYNVAASAKKPQLTRVSRTVWTADHLRQFLAFTTDDPWAEVWLLYAMTGMRRGEALGLQWSDVDTQAATVKVQRSRTSVNYAVETGDTKTGRGRNIALDPFTCKSLKKLYKKQRLAFGSEPSPGAWVFVDAAGTPLHPNKVTERFAVLQEKLRREIVKRHEEAGAKGAPPVLPTIRLHDLRHTHATLLLAAGEPVKVVSERLGHATVSITMDTYQHVIPSMQEAAAERIGALVFA